MDKVRRYIHQDISWIVDVLIIAGRHQSKQIMWVRTLFTQKNTPYRASKMNALILVSLVAVIAVVYVDAHGRMWEPAGRGTEWRRGYIVPEAKKDYNDMEGNCGGKTVQWQQNGGECGVCGDNWADPEPREHEDGGKYDNGYITGTYVSGQVIEIQIDVTANHLGWIEFRLCARDSRNTSLTHQCLGQHVLENANGETRFWIGSAIGVLTHQIQLPAGVTCTHCVIQWKYNTGNDWGVCPNGTGLVGCSDTPEQFYSCADVEITDM